MIFKIFTAILSAIMALFGISPAQPGVQPVAQTTAQTPTQLNLINPPNATSYLATILPADAHVATSAEISTIRTKHWRSAVRARTVLHFNDYLDAASKQEWPKHSLMLPDVAPADAQYGFAGASCDGRGNGYVWFTGSVMHYVLNIKGNHIMVYCDEENRAEHKEAMDYIAGNPTVYLDAAGNMYLKRSDGLVSKWVEDKQ